MTFAVGSLVTARAARSATAAGSIPLHLPIQQTSATTVRLAYSEMPFGWVFVPVPARFARSGGSRVSLGRISSCPCCWHCASIL